MTTLARPRTLSARGVAFVARWEGLRSVPYNDAAGNATIGYGHLLHAGAVTATDQNRWGAIDNARALELLAADLETAAAAVRELVAPPFVFPWRFDAIASFVYNVGAGAFEHSTLLARLNGSFARRGAADQLLLWTHAGGRVLSGLVARRQAERSLFLYGRY